MTAANRRTMSDFIRLALERIVEELGDVDKSDKPDRKRK